MTKCHTPTPPKREQHNMTLLLTPLTKWVSYAPAGERGQDLLRGAGARDPVPDAVDRPQPEQPRQGQPRPSATLRPAGHRARLPERRCVPGPFFAPFLGAWPGLAWPGLAWPGLAWPVATQCCAPPSPRARPTLLESHAQTCGFLHATAQAGFATQFLFVCMCACGHSRRPNRIGIPVSGRTLSLRSHAAWGSDTLVRPKRNRQATGPRRTTTCSPGSGGTPSRWRAGCSTTPPRATAATASGSGSGPSSPRLPSARRATPPPPRPRTSRASSCAAGSSSWREHAFVPGHYLYKQGTRGPGTGSRGGARRPARQHEGEGLRCQHRM